MTEATHSKKLRTGPLIKGQNVQGPLGLARQAKTKGPAIRAEPVTKEIKNLTSQCCAPRRVRVNRPSNKRSRD
jgi:hypothetical protein